MGILSKKLPSNMKSQLFVDFIDAFEEESQEIKKEIIKKKYLYDVDNMDYQRLLEVSSLLSVPFDVSINGSDEFLRNEVREIPFKVRYQGTVKFFKSLFGVMKRRGAVYLCYFNGSSLIRHAKNLLENASESFPDKPYVHLSEENFTGRISNQRRIDTGWNLDEGVYLDEGSVRQNTKHFILEVFLDTHFFSGEEGSAPDSGLYPSTGLAPSISLAPSLGLSPEPRMPYLITNEFFSYILTNVQDLKKVSDTVHVGCQLNVLCDSSKVYDSYTNSFTMPEMLLFAVTSDALDLITDVNDFSYIQFGTGRRVGLPSRDGTGVFPESLASPIASINIFEEEKYETDDWYGVSARYNGFLVNNEKLGVGDGETSDFIGSTNISPIKRKNFEILFSSGSQQLSVKDDGFGNLVGDAKGTIAYDNGLITLQTDVDQTIYTTAGVGDGEEVSFSYTDPFDRPINIGSIVITYVLNGTSYVAKDVSGTIVGESCSGTVTYGTGQIDLLFSLPPTGNLKLQYDVNKKTIPDLDSDINIKYFFDKSVDRYITEAGLFDKNNNLVAYTSFPRIKFNDFTNHLSLSFLIKKTSF